MSVWSAILLGLVKGVTEFLPISSSGHLSIINNLFKVNGFTNGGQLFDTLVRLAVLLAVIYVYRFDISRMFRDLLGFINPALQQGQQTNGRHPYVRMLLMVLLGAIPMILAIPVYRQLQVISSRNIIIGIMLVLTGCVLFTADKMTQGKKNPGNMRVTDALIIGLCQCVSVIPGLSRVAVTMTGGIAVGLRKDYALRYSFLISIPALIGGVIGSIADTARAGGAQWSEVPVCLAGMAAALVSSIISIRAINLIAAKGRFGGFAYYCWVVGVLAVILTMIF